MANPAPEVPRFGPPVARDRPLVHFLLPPACFERPENFRRAQAPPLALLTLAALAAREGWDVRVCDALHQPLPAERPDLVGMTVYTQNAPMAYALAAGYRDQGVPVVLGGVHVSMLPVEGLRHAEAVVAGEAEGVMERMLGDAAAGRLAGVYRGEWEAMDGVPSFDEYLPFGRQLPRRTYPSPFAYQTTRGCRFNCSFCSVIRINGRGQRHRSPDEVVEHFRELYGRVRRPFDVYLVDDDFAADLDASLALCEALAAADLPVTFGAQSSIGIGASDAVLDTVYRGGLHTLHNIGLDSFSRRDLLIVNKKNRPHTYADHVDRIHRHGLVVSGSVIFGIADDPVDVYLEAGDLAADLGLDSAMFNVLTPMPGTETFATLHAEDRISTFDWALYDATHCVIRPEGEVTGVELEQVRVDAYRRYLARVPSAYDDQARELIAREQDELVARHGPDDEVRWVSYVPEPDDLAQLVQISSADANLAITTAVDLAVGAGVTAGISLGERVPTGWYLLGVADDWPAGTVRPWSAFGVELVAWADRSGTVAAADAYCAHLGAHLGFGGVVDEADRLVCPFHGWCYDTGGAGVGEAKADLVTHPVRRVGDRWYVFLAHDAAGAAEPWEPPDLHRPPRDDPPRLVATDEYLLTAHQQVIIEGDFDRAHFPIVHRRGFVADDAEFDDHGARVAYTVTEPTPQQVRFELDGLSRVREQVAFDDVELLLVADSVSVDAHTTRTTSTMAVWAATDAAARAVATRIERLLARDLRRDAAIWEHRDYEASPTYGPDDALLIRFRRWAERFY